MNQSSPVRFGAVYSVLADFLATTAMMAAINVK